MAIKSFDEYFAGYKNYDNGGELDQTIVADAKKVFEALKVPAKIDIFHAANYEKQQKMVKGLDEGHSGFSFACVCSLAHKYADYKATEEPYTFDEYFADYKNYDDGGELDQMIVADAKKVFETLKTPERINEFYKFSYEKQQETVKGLNEGHSGFSFGCVCRSAYEYAEYAKKYVKENTLQNKAERISEQDLLEALNNVKYDRTVVEKMIDKHPDMIKILSDAKDNDGKPLFDALDIDDILFNCKDDVEKHPERIVAILNNPKEIEMISFYNSKGAGLWRSLGDPLNSTVDMNPEAFGMKPKTAEKSVDKHKKTAKEIDNALRKKLGKKEPSKSNVIDKVKGGRNGRE